MVVIGLVRPERPERDATISLLQNRCSHGERCVGSETVNVLSCHLNLGVPVRHVLRFHGTRGQCSSAMRVGEMAARNVGQLREAHVGARDFGAHGTLG